MESLWAILAAKLAVCGRGIAVRREGDFDVVGTGREMLASCFSSSDRVRNSLALLLSELYLVSCLPCKYYAENMAIGQA